MTQFLLLKHLDLVLKTGYIEFIEQGENLSLFLWVPSVALGYII